MEPDALNIAVVGCGRWGPNHLRVFEQQRGARVRWMIDSNATAFAELPRIYPHVRFAANADQVLGDADTAAIVIATPATTHFELARAALDAGKHVLVEKPLCTSRRDAQTLAELAEARGRVLMVGHVFLFHDVVRELNRHVAEGTLGRVLYAHSVRSNLGPIRSDVNAVYDLASHDISIFMRLFGEAPHSVCATAHALLGTPREDVAVLALEFSGGRCAFIHVSWIDPCKVRRLTVVGDRRMAVWDDVNVAEPLRLYDKGVEEPPKYHTFGEFHLRVREADMLAPRIRQEEPLARQAAAFLGVIRDGNANPCDGRFGADVLAVLEAATASIRDGGGRVEVERSTTLVEISACRTQENANTVQIPLVDLAAQHAPLRGEILAGIDRIATRSEFILGWDVEQFEAEFAAYCGTRHCIGVGNGLDALRLILEAYGIGPGDEVITAGNTFIATALAISATGATPVLVDCDPQTYTIDPARVEAALSERTRAIIPVHLYGQPADMRPILDLARSAGVRVIEDAAQAHGAEYHGRRCGSLGDAAAFSFYPGKNLGAWGDGGAITTSDDALAEQLRMLRNYGSVRKYVHGAAGCNSRLDSVQACVLRAKLRRLDEWNQRRGELAGLYDSRLASLGLAPPLQAGGRRHVFHLYVVRTARRDDVLKSLARHGIQAGIHYPTPIHRQAAYRNRPLRCGDLTNTERFANEIISLPLYPGMTLRQVEYVVEHLQRALDGKAASPVRYPQLVDAVRGAPIRRPSRDAARPLPAGSALQPEPQQQ